MSHRTMRRMKRAAPLRTMLDYAALIGLALAMIFQVRIQWTLAGVENPLSLEAVLVVVTAAALAIVGPALLSALIPNTPAGQLLQRIGYRTAGFVVTIAFSVFLIYYTFQLMISWWLARPVVAESGMAVMQAIMMTILMIGVPALAWTQIDPQRLIDELKQAHLVKRYELMQAADLAVLQKGLLRAEALALKGWANMLPAERQEFAAIGNGIRAGLDQTLRELSQTTSRAAGTVISFRQVSDSPEYLDAVDDLADLLLVAGDVDDLIEHESPASDHAIVRRADAETSDRERPDAGRDGPPRPRAAPASNAREQPPWRKADYDQALAGLSAPARQHYLAALAELGHGAWTRADLEETLSIEKTKALDIIKEWKRAQLIVQLSDPAYRYRFVEVSG